MAQYFEGALPGQYTGNIDNFSGDFNSYLASDNANYLRNLYGNFGDVNDPNFNSQALIQRIQADRIKNNTSHGTTALGEWMADNSGLLFASAVGAGAASGAFGAGAGDGLFTVGTGGLEGTTAAGADSWGGLAGYGADGASSFMPETGYDFGQELSTPEFGSTGTTPTLYDGNLNLGSNAGFDWNALGKSVGKGALFNGGKTAIMGGKGSDILKSAGYGALGGAIGSGISQVNPGSYVTTDPQYQSIVNRGVSGATSSGLSGGNVGLGALMGAGTQTGNVVGGNLYNGFMSPSGDGGGGSMPNFDGSGMLSGSADGMNAIANSDPYGRSPYYDVGQQSPGSSDSFGAGVGSYGTPNNTPQQQSNNPLMSQALSLLGGKGDGSFTPKFGDMSASLMGLYNNYLNKKRLGGLANGLSDMYSPNSAYAQQMKQQLDRRDAAAGRRSQYGPRAVELQANLANANAHLAPTLQGLYAAQGQQNGNMLGNLWRVGSQSGLGQPAQDWGQGLWNQYMGSPMAAPNVGPQLND